MRNFAGWLSFLARLAAGVIVRRMAKHDPDLTRIFQALSDPTRRAMLAALGRGALPVTELQRPTGLSLPTVMKHIAVLEEAELITTRKQGRTRLCAPRPETLAATADWLTRQRDEWGARLDRFDAYVMSLMKEDDHDA